METSSAVRQPGFNELIHAPTRLALMSLLSAACSVEFGTLRDALELSDSATSKQLATLERAGFVVLTRAGVGRGKRVHVELSPDGRAAYREHVAALRAIVGREDVTEGSTPPQEPPLRTGSGRRDDP